MKRSPLSKKPFFDPNRPYVPRTTPRSSDRRNPFEEFKQTRAPHDTTFQKLVEIAASRFGMTKQLGSIRICNEARKILKNYFPSASIENFQVVAFQDGQLKISASSSTWSHRLTMKKSQLQIEINKQIGAESVHKIVIYTSSAPSIQTEYS